MQTIPHFSYIRIIPRVSGVFGCGHILGELVIHVTEPITHQSMEEIKWLLGSHNYNNPFTVHQVCAEEHSGRQEIPVIEAGAEIRAQTLPGHQNPYEYGSLGCYVNIEFNTPGDGSGDASNSSGHKNAKELYGLTCAHVLNECKENVDIYHGDRIGFASFGQRVGLKLDERLIGDIEAIKIDHSLHASCSLELKRQNSMELALKWNVLPDPLNQNLKMRDLLHTGDVVHKNGSTTEFTLGEVVSTNYMKSRSALFEPRKESGLLNENQLSLGHTLLFQPLPSKNEDSPGSSYGSVGGECTINAQSVIL